MNNRYKTKDLGESAMLLSVGFKLIETQWQGEVAYFVFDKGDEAEKVAHEYHFSGTTVIAKLFHDNMILIKRKILAKYRPDRFKKDVRSYTYGSK